LDDEQLTEPVARVHAALGALASRGRPRVLDPYRSIVLVHHPLRHNPVQQVAAELLGISQATVSRRLKLPSPVVEQVLAQFVPDLAKTCAGRVVLVQGTLAPTWD
jgi:hypothetical protein